MPGGVLGQRLGARLTFVVIGLVAFAATLRRPSCRRSSAARGCSWRCSRAARPRPLPGRHLSGFRRRIRGLVSAEALGVRAGTADHGTQLRPGLDPAAHRHAHVWLGWRQAPDLDEPAGARCSSRCGLGTAATRRASIHRCPSRSSRRSAAQPKAHSSITLRQLLRAHRQSQRAAAVHLLHVHELHLLSALELGVSSIWCRNAISPRSTAAGSPMAPPLARRGRARGRAASLDRASHPAFRQSLGLSHRAARVR